MVALPLAWAAVTPRLGEYMVCPSATPTQCYQLYSFLQLITIDGFNRFLHWIGTPNEGQGRDGQHANNGGGGGRGGGDGSTDSLIRHP